MEAEYIILTIRNGVESELKRRPYETAKDVFARIALHIEHTEKVKVSPAWLRSALSKDFSPRLVPAMAAFNGIQKMLQEQEDTDKLLEPLVEDEARLTEQYQKDASEKDEEPLVYLEMLKAGKL